MDSVPKRQSFEERYSAAAQNAVPTRSSLHPRNPSTRSIWVRVRVRVRVRYASELLLLYRERKIVEHICLLKAKDDLSDEQEKDMLDYLYTSQYQMGGIIATTLGRIENQNPDGYTHAVFMRFQRKEDIARFYQNSSYLGVLENHVMPHCHVLTNVDYESEVEDDILPIFRKGEDFNYGVEYMILIAIDENAPREQIDDALGDLEKLEVELPSLIVQCTQGANLNISDSEYTHAAVVRFRSAEAFNMFLGDSKYRDIWASKFQPITQKALAVHFPVDPVGTEIM
ncbi:hypothetical protein Sjap_020609 [Stephania japonica]|uniref:Stress-response A/B barrel domain-containing protein n=1 Tax=Stephania japonica TaxID=461633 RepID=A0AAP0F3P4_9MAGN